MRAVVKLLTDSMCCLSNISTLIVAEVTVKNRGKKTLQGNRSNSVTHLAMETKRISFPRGNIRVYVNDDQIEPKFFKRSLPPFRPTARRVRITRGLRVIYYWKQFIYI